MLFFLNPPEFKRVFDRFFRSVSASASDQTGSGVGLAIVKVVAERHGATVSLATSSRLGGLCVEVHFARPASISMPILSPPLSLSPV